MKTLRAHPVTLAIAALAVAACQEMPTSGDKTTTTGPVVPQISESQLRERAQAQLATGVKQYDAGEYDAAVKSLTGSLEHGLLSKADQARARKYLAFSHCVSGRENLCGEEFRKAFEIYPDFALTAAEDGHPIWGPVYRNVRTQLITEREAAQRKPVNIIPLSKSEQMLADGIVKYDSGEYPAALKLLEGSMKEGLSDSKDKVRAMKYTAFTLCLENKFAACRAEFIKIYDVDKDFDLTPAEAGHPSWTKTFAAAKAHAKKEIAARESKEKTAKEKGAAPPAAAVPKK
jgi:tetratricopeptide (TPR) repeat protein